MRNADGGDQADVVSQVNAPRAIAFVLLLATAGILECWQLAGLGDPEIWGHLGIGGWILEHKSLPESGVFSQAASLPWRDFSWGFDVLVAVMHRILGLRGLPALLMFFRMGLAAMTFQLAGGWRNFWTATALSAIGQYILFSAVPLVGFVSVLLLGVEFFWLLEWRASGKLRWRFALPSMFFVWANMDLGFVYGMVLYALFLTVLVMEAWDESGKRRWLEHAAARIPLPAAMGMGIACFVAGCVTPNGLHACGAFFADEFSAINANLASFHAMGFRQPQDYVLMLLGMAAFLSLGMMHSRDLFSIALLSGSAAMAFFAQRENWLLTLASVAVLGNVLLRSRKTTEEEQAIRWTWQRPAFAGAAVVVAFFVFVIRVPQNQDALLAKVAEKLPVHAADFLRQHPQPAPFFNPYQWGGFLTWYLPEYPVAVDERRGLYPERQELDYFQAMNAGIPYRNFPPMNQARTFLMDKAGAMGEAFRGVAGFQVLYEDNLAIVYSHEVRE